MFLDFSDGSQAVPSNTDICIIGAGVMGLAIAEYLVVHSSRQVLIVEEGGLEDTETASAVPAELSAGDLPSGVARSRARGFGGSSRRWGGQALPFMPLDVGKRPYRTEPVNWPISWDELNRWYPAVDRFLGLSAIPFDTDLWRCERVTAPFNDRDELELGISKYSPHAYLANMHRGWIAQSDQAHCLLHAKVAEIGTIPEPWRVRSVGICGCQGQRATIKANVVVLCAGGIENARILLASQRSTDSPLGPASDLVGRYYQDHIGFFAAKLEPIDWKAFCHLFTSFIPGNQKYLPKLHLAQTLQSRLGLLNVTGNLDVGEADDSPRSCAKRVYNSWIRRRSLNRSVDSTLADLRRLVSTAPASIDLLNTHLFKRRVGLPRDGRFYLMANAETEPLAASRIILTDKVDIYGLQRPQVNWLVNDHTLKALQAYGKVLKRTLESAKIASVKVSPYLTDPAADWKERAYSLYHHMGATRMSFSQRDGVVDSWGRMHGVANLMIAGTSVLPSGSASNPSYTGLALALRSADKLIQESS